MPQRTRGSPALLILAALPLVFFVLPAATASDDSDCATCHENLEKAFRATVHGRIRSFETPDGRIGCGTCHGDGTKHVESGGDPAAIRGLGSESRPEETDGVCLACHRSESLHDWAGGEHALNGVGCGDCHDPHAPPGEAVGDPDVCYPCHQSVQAQFQYPSHHPLREGHMKCGSCHQPHGSSIGMLADEERSSELCLACHTHLQGPFVFEHEAVFEGCESCHAPHGAVANNLLVQSEPFLCLQCHEMHFHAGLEGEEDLEAYVPAYDPDFDSDTPRATYPGGLVPNPFGPAGYKVAFTTKCTQCHTQIHGSDLPSQTVPGLGRALMR